MASETLRLALNGVMVMQEGIENLNALINELNDAKIRETINHAIRCLDNPGLNRIVSDDIKKITTAGYGEISLELLKEAHKRYPNNPYFLTALGTALIKNDECETAISKIEDFLKTPKVKDLKESENVRVMITLSSAYKGVGNIDKTVRILEGLPLKGQVIDKLGEAYFISGDYNKAKDMLRRSRDADSRLLLAKIYDSQMESEEALNALEPVKDHPKVRDFYQELEAKAYGSPGEDKIFLVHGHNVGVVFEINTFLSNELNLETKIMNLEAHAGRTLTEKFEEIARNCSFAIFFFTADDDLIIKSEGHCGYGW